MIYQELVHTQQTLKMLRNDPLIVDNTRGDQKIRGKVLLNRIAFIDSNESSLISTIIHSKLTEIDI